MRRSEAYAALLLLTVAAFLAASLVPYRVDTDTGFQLRSLQQWTRGETPSPGTLRVPDAGDLSQDALVWSSWWPPGFPFLYAPLAAAGLSLAATLRITSFLIFLAGTAGWMRLADRTELSRATRLLFAVALAAYALTLGGAASLRSADNLSFAAAPWLILLVLRRDEPEPSYARLVLCGAALGASYWLKYTLFVAALPLAAWLAVRLLLREKSRGALALLRPAALGLGMVLPVIALIALNAAQSGDLAESTTGARSTWNAEDLASARPLSIALGAAGAPGLALFQSHLWISHLVYFSDGRLPFLRTFDNPQRLLLKSLLGLPGTAALLWGLWRARRDRGMSRLLALGLTALGGFYVLLGAVSLAVEYNYPANEPRFAAAVMPLLYPLLLASWLTAARRQAPPLARTAALLAFVVFFLAPVAFATADFVRNEIGGRRAPAAASSTGLYIPEISPRDVPRVQARIAGLLRSPRDVVVLAGPAGWGSSFMMWLETPWRTLPVTTFCLPLGGRYVEAADLRASLPLTSSKPLRVVLVASLSLQERGWLSRLQARFPQARAWTPAAPVPGSNVGIWVSDLEVEAL
ncbi:MAG TPA: hypothetical protein VKM72_00365 [Thermoanaerobaculia bacterium]|nr:hypothetical protein [Thermoanaerobaculia bacterium]